MKKFAFSVIEILVVLITMGVLAGALTPSLTKKMQNASVQVAKSEVRTQCPSWSDCIACTSTECTACKKTCAVGQKVQVSNCSCVNCPSGCLTCTENICTACKTGYGLTNGACSRCTGGTYSDGTTNCRPSPAGNYSGDEATTYSPCPVGRYQDKTGQNDCIDCPAGTYQNKTGQTGCIECPADHRCPTKTTDPIACANKKGAVKGQSSCSDCPGNCFIDCIDPNQCLKCNGGYYLKSGKCESCPGGYYCNGTSAVLPCAAGTYSTGGASSCTPCPSNQISPEAATTCSSCLTTGCKTCDLTGCTKCNANYKLVNGACESCPPGTYSAEGAVVCTSCGGGCTACSASGCSSCQTGYTLVSGKCIKCAQGTYLKNGACVACDPGYYQNAEGQTSCKICPKGTYSADNRKSCPPCTGKNYSSSDGSASCSVCSSNGYVNSDNTGCTECGDDHYLNDAGNGCVHCIGDMCATCDRTGCLSCNVPWAFLENKKCKRCNAAHGEGCKECTKSECTKCEENYTLTSAKKCVSNFCSGSSFVKFDNGNKCITAVNMGDAADLPIPSSVKVHIPYVWKGWNWPNDARKTLVSAGTECITDTPCCWTGKKGSNYYLTSGGCDLDGTGYTGCYRTVCNWYGAAKVCDELVAGGRDDWRLPTVDEFTKAYNDARSDASICGGDSDIDSLKCEIYSGHYANSKRYPVCYGGNNKTSTNDDALPNSCEPGYYWAAQSATQQSSAYRIIVNGDKIHGSGSVETGSGKLDTPYSVRCVLDKK